MEGMQIAEHGWIEGCGQRILAWYLENGRHEYLWRTAHLSEWELLVVELLLEKTPADRVSRVIRNILTRTCTPWMTARASESELTDILRPLGLQRQRARHLRALARRVCEMGGRLPASLEDLEKLPSVGEYSAAAFLVVAHGRRVAAIDANMIRIAGRLLARELVGGRRTVDARRVTGQIVESLMESLGDVPSKHVLWSLLDFAGVICRARWPRRDVCPLSDLCPSAKRKSRAV